MHADLQQVASLVDLLDVFVGKNAASPLQLALALSGSSWDDSFMQTGQKGTGRENTTEKDVLSDDSA